MTGVNGKDLTPTFFRNVAARLAWFAQDEQKRHYRELRRTSRHDYAMRGTWLTDKGLGEVERLDGKS